MGKRKRLKIVSTSQSQSVSQRQMQPVQSSSQSRSQNQIQPEQQPEVAQAPQLQSQVTTSVTQGERQPSMEASQSQREQEESVEPSLVKFKKVRGPTRMLDIWEMNKEKHIAVQLNAEYIPIGEESCTLSRFIGSMMRRAVVAPIDYTNWNEMPAENKVEMWDIVKSKFDFILYKSDVDEKITEEMEQEQLEVAKSWVFKNMSGKWRQWKNSLKSARFDPSKSVDGMVEEMTDTRVHKEQYKKLVEYWSSEKAKEISLTNQTNRLKLVEPHCTGTKSFARIIAEKAKDANGMPPSRAHMYIYSRTKKDGTIVSEKASEVVEQLKAHMNESGNSSNQQESWENDVYFKVKGPEKKGRVRYSGNICASSSRSGSSSQQNEVVLGLKSHISGLEQKLEHQSQVLVQQSQVLNAVLSLLNKRFPEENVNDVMAEANQMVNQLAADANSAPNNSPNVHHSSNSSFHPDQGNE